MFIYQPQQKNKPTVKRISEGKAKISTIIYFYYLYHQGSVTKIQIIHDTVHAFNFINEQIKPSQYVSLDDNTGKNYCSQNKAGQV